VFEQPANGFERPGALVGQRAREAPRSVIRIWAANGAAWVGEVAARMLGHELECGDGIIGC
jgi:hypothetical protein